MKQELEKQELEQKAKDIIKNRSYMFVDYEISRCCGSNCVWLTVNPDYMSSGNSLNLFSLEYVGLELGEEWKVNRIRYTTWKRKKTLKIHYWD